MLNSASCIIWESNSILDNFVENSWGGGEVIDGWTGVFHFGSSIGTQKFNFGVKVHPQIYFTRFYACHFSKENWRQPPVSEAAEGVQDWSDHLKRASV